MLRASRRLALLVTPGAALAPRTLHVAAVLTHQSVEAPPKSGTLRTATPSPFRNHPEPAVGGIDAGQGNDDDDDEMVQMVDPATGEWGGPTRGGTMPEPTRYGDWERRGRCSDF